MPTVRRLLAPFAISLGVITAVHCGGATATQAVNGDAGIPDSGPVDSASDAQPVSNDAACHNPSPLPVGRPTAAACPVTSIAGHDAGSVACSTLADCQDAGGTDVGFYQACRANQCVFDECLSDGDCSTGQVCGCASEFHGNAIHVNRCIDSQCSVDSDCGAGGTCSPTFDVNCGSLQGYYCRSAADTCTTDSSCCDNDSGRSPQCNYAPELGHFTCQDRVGCGG